MDRIEDAGLVPLAGRPSVTVQFGWDTNENF
jgi:hypothetical protein